MKKYIAPSLKVFNVSSEDIIQTSGEIANVPTNVVKGVKATDYGATSFSTAYGDITKVSQ